MIQLILIIYLCISIHKMGNEKEVSGVPYMIATISLTLLPSLLVMLTIGEFNTEANILGSVLGIAMAFIPRAIFRSK